MDELIAFFRGQLDRDEKIALACLGVGDQVRMRRGTPPPRWLPDDMSIRSADGILRVRHTWVSERNHICRHDPASVLADIAADRAILARYEALQHPASLKDRAIFPALAEVVGACIRDRAARFSGHPDYTGLPSTT